MGAFWCCAPDYTIQHASMEAHRLWGSILTDKSFLSLVGDESGVLRLKTAFDSDQSMAGKRQGVRSPPGFAVRELGYETFASKANDKFDCSVIAVHFPAEFVREEPAVLIVLEPCVRSCPTAPALQRHSEKSKGVP